jgi:hypothetical protein
MYKELIEDLQHVSASQRTRQIEAAQQYLNQAKDAMYKKQQIEIQKNKQVKSKDKAEDKAKETETVSRQVLFEKIDELKRMSTGSHSK